MNLNQTKKRIRVKNEITIYKYKTKQAKRFYPAVRCLCAVTIKIIGWPELKNNRSRRRATDDRGLHSLNPTGTQDQGKRGIKAKPLSEEK